MKIRSIDSVRSVEAVRKWCEGKPRILVSVALQAVASCEDATDALKWVRNRHTMPVLFHNAPNLDEWFYFYRHGLLSLDEVASLDGEWEVRPTQLMRLFKQGIGEFKKDPDAAIQWIKDNPEDAKEIHASSHELFYEIEMESLNAATGNVGPDPEISDEQLSESTGTRFFLCVFLPCWIEYREFVGFLFRRARQGDIDAIEKLLRVDKAVLFEPRIRDYFLKAAFTKRGLDYQRMCQALVGRPSGRHSLKKIKYAMASLIKQFSEGLNRPLPATEIRELFDAAAMSQGHQRDFDLPESDDAFYKAIVTRADTWRWPEGKDKD